MNILLRCLSVLMIMAAGMLAACDGTSTIQGTGTGYVMDGSGNMVPTQQSIDVKATRKGLGAPGIGGLMNGMLGGTSTGGGYGAPYYQPSSVSGFGGYVPGTVIAPDGSATCNRRKPSGAYDCLLWYTPPPSSYYAGGGRYYGTGQYYYNPRTGTQQQDIRPGFKVNLMPDGTKLSQEERELFEELERKLKFRQEEDRLSKFQGA